MAFAKYYEVTGSSIPEINGIYKYVGFFETELQIWGHINGSYYIRRLASPNFPGLVTFLQITSNIETDIQGWQSQPYFPPTTVPYPNEVILENISENEVFPSPVPIITVYSEETTNINLTTNFIDSLIARYGCLSPILLPHLSQLKNIQI